MTLSVRQARRKRRSIWQAEQARELAAELDRRVAARTLELQRANEELDAFAHVVSHDLRAPLRRMSSFSRFSRILNDEYRERLDSHGVKLRRFFYSLNV